MQLSMAERSGLALSSASREEKHSSSAASSSALSGIDELLSEFSAMAWFTNRVAPSASANICTILIGWILLDYPINPYLFSA
jgi:hypothetical protein